VHITIDKNSGFCFGVLYAIELAEHELDAGHELYCLGDIVHNDLEVDRLTRKGLRIIDHQQFQSLTNVKVLIRAHGEPPETYRTAIENNIELIDASCPVVLKLQNRVKGSFDKIEDSNAQIVIYGKPGHAEVNGLLGQTDGKAIVITSEDDLDKIDFTKPIHLYSQTTKSTANFERLTKLITERAAAHGNDCVEANDTICRQVSNREPSLREFSAQHDVIIFVAGRKSSNGKVLFDVCKSVNDRSYFISSPDELDSSWFEQASGVGICGATSTPMWLMEKVAEAISRPVSVN
jgi:4-hydroxy-3-methylbut-2-enyl diphosphate reductase